MRGFAVTLLALYLSVGAAAAQTNQQMIWAMGEVGAEMQVCSVYFTIVSGCLAGQVPPVTDTSEKYQHAAENLALLGLANQKTAGISLSYLHEGSVPGHEENDGDLHKHRRAVQQV